MASRTPPSKRGRAPAGSRPAAKATSGGSASASRPSSTSSSTASKRYPDAPFRRMALAPGIIATIILLAGNILLGLPSFIFILYPTAILALIVGYFAFQARHWWWIPPLLAIAVLWNPVLPFHFTGVWWGVAQFVAAAVFIGTAVFIRVRNTEDRNQRQGAARR